MNFNKLTKIDWKEINKDTIIWYSEIKDLCSRSYPNHPKGCINIKKCNRLNTPEFGCISNNYNYFYLIYIKFDFKKYRDLRLKEKDWWSVGRRTYNLYYYQNSLKSKLINYINNLHLSSDTYIYGCGSGFKLAQHGIIGSMENGCINVFSTMKLNGIKMEIEPEYIIYLVCLIMSKDKLTFKQQKRMF